MTDWLRKALLVVLFAALLIGAAGELAVAFVRDLRGIVASMPATVRAEAEADVMRAAALAVRADTRIASALPCVLIAGLALGLVAEAGVVVLVWRRALS